MSARTTAFVAIALALGLVPTRAQAGNTDAGVAVAPDAATPAVSDAGAASGSSAAASTGASADAGAGTNPAAAQSASATSTSAVGDSTPPSAQPDAAHTTAPAGSAGPTAGQDAAGAPSATGAPPSTTEISGSGDTVDYYTPRFEPAGFPIVGGNSDIGVLFGVAGTLSRFQSGVRPYFWNMDVVVDASIKNGPGGAEIAQQNYRWQWDIVGLFGGRVRMNPAAYYQRTIDQGYWGIGNGSTAMVPATVAGDRGRYFQFVMNEVRAWNSVRVAIKGPVSAQVSTIGRYVNPEIYPGSQLDIDAHTTNANGSPLIRGAREVFFTELTGVVIYDSRDDEIMPTRGLNHRVWLKYVQGFPTDAGVAYGAVGFSLAQYVHLGGPFVFASRLMMDAEFGDVPFYDLFRGGTPFPTDMPGGGGAVRGVPSGRYLGLFKVVGNAEIRALLVGFHIFGQSFRIGANVFFDAGRVWTDYTFNNPRDTNPTDNTPFGIKYGTGLGLYLRWGQAAIFRAEFAYSPDQAAQDPKFPIGIYVEDGVMF